MSNGKGVTWNGMVGGEALGVQGRETIIGYYMREKYVFSKTLKQSIQKRNYNDIIY